MNKILLASGIGFLLLLPFVFISPSPTPKAPVVPTEIGAIGACEEFITRSLNDPDSAKFEHSKYSSVSRKEDVWTVYSPVRAKNAFGSMIKANYACKMHFIGDSWYADSVKQIRP